MSISWNATPLRCSSVRARSQYGHQDLLYISTGAAMVCCCSTTGDSPARQRQVLGSPCTESAAQVEHLGEALLRQRPHGRGRGGAAVAIDDERALLVFRSEER